MTNLLAAYFCRFWQKTSRVQRITAIMINEITPPPATTAYPHGGRSSLGPESVAEFEDSCFLSMDMEVAGLLTDEVVGSLGGEGGVVSSPVVAHVD